MIGISTCWWENRMFNGDEIIDDILDLGLTGVELEYRIEKSLYEQMRLRLKTDLKVLSIHNFFPRPQERPKAKASGDLFLLSSTDNDERSMAVKLTIKTIEHANDLEVEPVILHLGRVDMINPTEGFRKFYEEGKIRKDKGEIFFTEQRRVRNSQCRKNLDAVLFSLDKLNHEAERNGIYLCIENRYHFNEIPSFDEIGEILREFDGGRIRYWHDAGHAIVQENLGICKQKKLLDAYAEMLVGIHLHDVRGLEDHLAPGQGEADLKEVISMLKTHHIKILEINTKRADRQELIKGIEFCDE